MVQIENTLTADEYNSLRKQIGWEIKDNNIIENAIKESKFVKKAMIDNNCQRRGGSSPFIRTNLLNI